MKVSFTHAQPDTDHTHIEFDTQLYAIRRPRENRRSNNAVHVCLLDMLSFVLPTVYILSTFIKVTFRVANCIYSVNVYQSRQVLIFNYSYRRHIKCKCITLQRSSHNHKLPRTSMLSSQQKRNWLPEDGTELVPKHVGVWVRVYEVTNI